MLRWKRRDKLWISQMNLAFRPEKKTVISNLHIWFKLRLVSWNQRHTFQRLCALVSYRVFCSQFQHGCQHKHSFSNYSQTESFKKREGNFTRCAAIFEEKQTSCECQKYFIEIMTFNGEAVPIFCGWWMFIFLDLHKLIIFVVFFSFRRLRRSLDKKWIV